MGSETNEFDVIEWINKISGHSDSPINANQIKPVLHFALLWNVFESVACHKSASVNKIDSFIDDLIKKGHLQEQRLGPHLDYFRQRYISNGSINLNFTDLKFRNNNAEKTARKITESVLTDNGAELSHKAKAILYIVFRFRNNLFHGEKNILTLNYQVDNFNVANQVLAMFLDCKFQHSV